MSERLTAVPEEADASVTQPERPAAAVTPEGGPGGDEAVEVKATGSEVRDEVAGLLQIEREGSFHRDIGFADMLAERAKRAQESDRLRAIEELEQPGPRPHRDFL